MLGPEHGNGAVKGDLVIIFTTWFTSIVDVNLLGPEHGNGAVKGNWVIIFNTDDT